MMFPKLLYMLKTKVTHQQEKEGVNSSDACIHLAALKNTPPKATDGQRIYMTGYNIDKKCMLIFQKYSGLSLCLWLLYTRMHLMPFSKLLTSQMKNEGKKSQISQIIKEKLCLEIWTFYRRMANSSYLRYYPVQYGSKLYFLMVRNDCFGGRL